MTQEIETTALALPSKDKFISDIKAINEFQQVARQFLVEGADWGVIPGTQKPTLLKPGAEKIAKLLGLADHYLIEDKKEDWQAGFFRYLIKCQLVSVNSGVVISEGLGECNSMESKYRWRWVGERDLPQGIDKTNLISQVRTSRAGGKWTVYRLDNEDIYSQVNTILKMAKKRAIVDAALSAGRLSQVFTQDLEDMIHDEPKPVVIKANKGEEPQRQTTPPVYQKESNPPSETTTTGGEQEETEDLKNLDIRNLGDLFSACLHHIKDADGKPISQAEVLKELGGIAKEDIADPKDAWLQILTVKK